MALIFFLVLGAASAASADSVSINEDSNLDDSVSTLSSQLESSNEVSISETNLVNSQNDNLGNSSSVLAAVNSEVNNNDSQDSNKEVSDNNTNVLKSSDKQVASATNNKVPVKMTVVSAVSDDASTLFKVKLTDSENGKVLSDRKVNIIVQGKNLVGTTGSDGIAQITSQPLDKGTYTFTLKFSGTASRYAATTVTQKVAVTKAAKVPVKMAVVSAMTDEVESVFMVQLSDRQTGQVLQNRKVNIVLQGKNLVGTTDENGIAKITASPLKAGNYAVTLKFSGTVSRYAAASVTHKVTVTQKVPVKMTVTSATSTKSASLFKIKVTDSENGKAVAGRKINLIVDGKNLVGTTDNKGIAQITAKPLSNGFHEVTMKFSGTVSRYAHTTVNQRVAINGFVPVEMTVLSATSSGSKTIFKVKVTDGENGKAVANRKVNVIVEGKNLVGTTDKNGVAQIASNALSKGLHTVTLKFSGTASRYLPATVTQSVAVDGFVPVKMTVTSALTNGIETVFKVKVTDAENGKAVANRKVNIIVEGRNLVGTTDKDGVARIVAQPLEMRGYDVTLKFSGTASRYVATTQTQTVAVSKTGIDKSKTVWINADGGSDGMKKAIVKLLREKGWTVYVGETYSNAHYTDYFKVTSDYKYYITLYNGFCAGTVREAYSSSIQNTLKSKGVQLVIMWDSSDWTNPDGMKPYRYGDFTGYNAARAWDDNFSNSDPRIDNVGAWLKSKNAFYCVSPTAQGLVQQFLAGGYFAYSGK